MILIKKMPPPLELEELKKEAEKQKLSDTEGYNKLRNPLKKQVREALMQEQGHLCAYCMCRIPDEQILENDQNVSRVCIEHWQARSQKNVTGENKGLDYNNMLAVCSGNVNMRKKRYYTCDRKRGDRPLTVNPLVAATLETIFYHEDGRIESRDEAINRDLQETLNLNCCDGGMTLPTNRKKALDSMQEELYKLGGDFYENCQEQLAFWTEEADPKTPYVGIIISWLKESLKSFPKA